MKTKRQIIREWVEQNGMKESQSATARAIYNDYSELFNSPSTVRSTLKLIIPELVGYVPRPKGGPTKEEREKITVEEKIEEKPINYDILSEQQLREMYDIKTIVIKALGELKEGEYWREADFIRRFLNGKTGFRSILDSKFTESFKGKASGQVFYSHPESIIKMKEGGILL